MRESLGTSVVHHHQQDVYTGVFWFVLLCIVLSIEDSRIVTTATFDPHSCRRKTKTSAVALGPSSRAQRLCDSVKGLLIGWRSQLCGSMTSHQPREDNSQAFRRSVEESGRSYPPFCCCSSDWLTGGWGVMAGGGGSAGWLCWLGRALVVPTAAAAEHTVHTVHIMLFCSHCPRYWRLNNLGAKHFLSPTMKHVQALF